MCITLGACRGVECNLHRLDWSASHTGTLDSFPPYPSSWVFSKLRTHTHKGAIFVKIDPCWKINKNSEKCEKMCIRLSALGWPDWCRFSILAAFFVFHTHMHPTHRKVSTPHCPSGLGFRQLCKNEQKSEKIWKNVETTRRMQGSRMHPSPAQLDYFAPSHPPFFPSIPTTLVFLKNFAHTHTRGCVFCQNRSMLENQQKFRKMWKNVHPIQRTGLVRVVSSSSFGCLFRFPHPNTRPTRYPLHTVWVGIRWILQK